MGKIKTATTPLCVTAFICRPFWKFSRLFLDDRPGRLRHFTTVRRNLLVFFLAWELELIPVYLLLSIWGGYKRLYAATKFILYTAGSSLFILVAENQELILNTILSRCQITKINKLTDEDIIAGLAAKGIGEDDARRIAFLSDGNYNEALKQLNHETNDHATLFLKWFRVGYKGNGIEMVNWVDAFAKLGRENQKQLLNYALYFMREFMVVKMTGNAQVRLQGDELTTAQNMTKVIEFDQIEKITKLLNDSYYYIERNANPKALFLDASIQLHKILRNKIPNSK